MTDRYEEGMPSVKVEDATQPLSPNGKESIRFKRAPCNDPFWAIVFIIQLIFLIILSAVYFLKHSSDFQSNSNDSFLNGSFVELVFITLGVSFVSAVFWVMMIRRYAECLVWFSLILCLSIWILIGIVLLVSASPSSCILPFILAAIQALWMYCIRHRIAFAAAVLETAVNASNTFPSVYLVSFLSVFVQGAWTLIWTTGFVFLIYDTSQNGSTNVSSSVIFLFVLSFYWTSQVIANIVLVTSAGVVATWYFLFPQATPESPVSGALKRACWNSLGSICFGSFLVAFLQALRAMLRMGQNQGNFFIRCCLMLILGCLENILNYFNLYAFTHVAVYGLTYCEAARGTWELFKSKGIDMIINDDLTGAVLNLACFFAGGCAGIVTALIAKALSNDYWLDWGFVAFFVGFVFTLCAMAVARAGVATIFVCFAEDPRCLATTKPDFYQKIVNAWTARWGSVPVYFQCV